MEIHMQDLPNVIGWSCQICNWKTETPGHAAFQFYDLNNRRVTCPKCGSKNISVKSKEKEAKVKPKESIKPTPTPAAAATATTINTIELRYENDDDEDDGD